MPFIKFSRSERRKISLFFICLAFALAAWLFFALSNSYVYQAKTLVRYVNFPQNKAFNSLQSDTVKLQIEGTGWQLLFSRLRINPQSIDVDLKQLNKQTFISLTDQLGFLNKQLASSQKIVYVQPDTLYFDFSSRIVKKVPITVLHEIGFVKQHGIADSIRVVPSYVTVTGPAEELANISSWKTDTVKLRDVQSSINTRISFERPPKANINIYPAMAELHIKVDEFTEKTVEIPLKIINNKQFHDVKLLPPKVRVTFLTALSNYQKFDRSYFEAVVDMDNWTNRKYRQLPVRLIEFPPFSRLIRVEPQNIDFIIQK